MSRLKLFLVSRFFLKYSRMFVSLFCAFVCLNVRVLIINYYVLPLLSHLKQKVTSSSQAAQTGKLMLNFTFVEPKKDPMTLAHELNSAFVLILASHFKMYQMQMS